MQMRPKIVLQNPEMVQPEVMKYIGHLWQDLQPAELAYYKKKAEVDKQRYYGQMAAFNKELQRVEKASSTKSDDVASEDSKKFNKASEANFMTTI